MFMLRLMDAIDNGTGVGVVRARILTLTVRVSAVAPLASLTCAQKLYSPGVSVVVNLRVVATLVDVSPALP